MFFFSFKKPKLKNENIERLDNLMIKIIINIFFKNYIKSKRWRILDDENFSLSNYELNCLQHKQKYYFNFIEQFSNLPQSVNF